MRGQLRIIAGKWRRTQIQFDARSNIRPTTDAARETLFNWLQWKIDGARCLDLFAGSGALGFEALSRGAQSVVFVDNVPGVIENLKQTARQLQTDQCDIVFSDFKKYLARCDQNFDIVFLDPPYHKGFMQQSIDMLHELDCFNGSATVYAECEMSADGLLCPESWEIFRESRSKKRRHALYCVQRFI